MVNITVQTGFINHPKHTANASEIIFLDIIEAVGDHLDRKLNKGQLKSKEELWEVLKEAEYNIPEDNQRKAPDRLLPQESILFRKCCAFLYCVHILCIFWLYLNKDTDK